MPTENAPFVDSHRGRTLPDGDPFEFRLGHFPKGIQPPVSKAVSCFTGHGRAKRENWENHKSGARKKNEEIFQANYLTIGGTQLRVIL